MTKHTRGFTLVETLVSILLFATIAMIVGSVFVSSLDIQRRANNIQQTEENASYVLETMIKEIRVSTLPVALADTDCAAAPLPAMAIINSSGVLVVYSLNGTDLIRNAGGVDGVMNSNTVQFQRLAFCVSGAQPSDSKQPRITIIASIQSKNMKQQITVDTQTTISLRGLSD